MTHRDLLPEYVTKIRKANENSSIILIGSVARNTNSERSDLDLLVLSEEDPHIPTAPTGFHVASNSATNFVENLKAGEDFEAWCIRLGTVLEDNGLWAQIKARPEAGVWPSWEKKIHHGTRRLFLGVELMKRGDLDAASEEMLYAIGHAIRGILLKSSVFPLSRPELEDQVRSLNYPQLAEIHRGLRLGENVSFRFLNRCQKYAKKLLCHLSTDVYALCAGEFRRKQRIKADKLRLRGLARMGRA